MDGITFTFAGEQMVARASGALVWPARNLLVVSDLHLGKSERLARRGGALLPPYEVIDTLTRLETDLNASGARQVICLGDSFDDLDAMTHLAHDLRLWLARLIAGRDWIWVEGNHDPGPVDLAGSHRADVRMPPLVFRHIAMNNAPPVPEVSGHYHPKHRLTLRGRQISRPCFLLDAHRLILPAYGTYTGGVRSDAAVFDRLFGQEAKVILTGPGACMLPART